MGRLSWGAKLGLKVGSFKQNYIYRAYTRYKMWSMLCFFPPAPWGWPSRGGAVLYRLSPQLGEDPPCWGPRVIWSSRGTGVAQLVARSTPSPDWCFVGSSPTCGTEHFGFPPSAPRLGNQRPWYVQPRLCDWAYKRSRATYRKEKGIVSRWSGSS